MEPAGVLDNGALPRNRHGQQEGVKTWVVEPFTEVAARCEDEPGLVVRLLSELCDRCTPGLGLDRAVENDEVRYLVAV